MVSGPAGKTDDGTRPARRRDGTRAGTTGADPTGASPAHGALRESELQYT